VVRDQINVLLARRVEAAKRSGCLSAVGALLVRPTVRAGYAILVANGFVASSALANEERCAHGLALDFRGLRCTIQSALQTAGCRGDAKS